MFTLFLIPLFLLQIEEYIRDGVCDDMAIYDDLPINWWLDNECICYLLATLVCRDLPDISNECSRAGSGMVCREPTHSDMQEQ